MKRTHDYSNNDRGDVSTAYPFKTCPRHSFDKKPPVLRKPKEIGCYSVNKQRCFKHDKSNMKYFINPIDPKRVKFDLTDGYHTMIRKDETKKEYIDNILHWIMCNKEKFQLHTSNKNNDSSQRDLFTDFICWRGLLTKLLCTPYENREDWLISITKFNNTIYMCEFDTEKRKRNKAEMTDRQTEMSCWGWKFEQYLTADKPDGKPVTSIPVNNNEEYATVVRTRLESHSLVFSGEVDALDANNISNDCSYVEFKTSREIDNPRQQQNFHRFKLIKWWAQSFLVGIPRIICGYRDDEGTVHRLETFNTLDIPRLVQELRDPWKPNVMMNFLDQLLSFIKKHVKENDPRMIYLMSWEPGNDVQLRKIGTSSEYQFLPDWYLNNSMEEPTVAKKQKLQSS